MAEKFYSVSEFAKLLGVSRQSIHNAIKRGILEASEGDIETVRLVKTKQRGLRISERELKKYHPDETRQWVGRKKNDKILALRLLHTTA